MAANNPTQTGVLCEIIVLVTKDEDAAKKGHWGEFCPDGLILQDSKSGHGNKQLGHVVRVRPCRDQRLMEWLQPYTGNHPRAPLWNLAIGAHDERMRIAATNGQEIGYDNGLWLVGCRVLCDFELEGQYPKVKRLYPLPAPLMPQELSLDAQYGTDKIDNGKQCQFNFNR